MGASGDRGPSHRQLTPGSGSAVVVVPVLNGLHHDYCRAAWTDVPPRFRGRVREVAATGVYFRELNGHLLEIRTLA